MASILAQRSFSIEVLKEPRGLLRALQWFFSMLAFATCSHYSTTLILAVSCTDPQAPSVSITRDIYYPFRVNKVDPEKFGGWCNVANASKPDGSSIYDVTFPGNYASDAEFFVFTGVVSWLFCFFSLAIYLFYASFYVDEQKNYPKIDFVVSAILAMFWLAGSAAWANGLSGLKAVCRGLAGTTLICVQEETSCASSCSQFSEGTISVVLGFLNCFLWSANLWFLYKETKWYKGGDQATGEARVESAQEPEPEPSPFQ